MPRRAPLLRLPPKLLRHARESRHIPTAAESRLWSAMRNGQLGVLIRRQQPLLGRFVVDFYCARARLCIEIDGDSHAGLGQAAYDEARTAALNRSGYRVLRFTNGQVETNLSAVLEAIRAACEPPSPPPSP